MIKFINNFEWVEKERYFTYLIAITFYTILQAQAGIRRIILKATEPCKKEQKRKEEERKAKLTSSRIRRVVLGLLHQSLFPLSEIELR